VLEDTNIKLSSVATDITGKSGRAILHALLQEEQDPQALADLARGRMREKREQLAQAVQGTLSEHHRFLLSSQLRQLDFFDGQLRELDQEIATRLGLPSGPDDPSAGQPTEDHLVSWAGLCPLAKISAGKQLSTKTGKGNRWLRQALIEAASAASRSKGTYLGAYYPRLRKRMGHKKAIVALAHRILVIIYHLLKEQQTYRELGPGRADEQALDSSKRWAIRRLEQLGYHVTLQPADAA
jgi:transposase